MAEANADDDETVCVDINAATFGCWSVNDIVVTAAAAATFIPFNEPLLIAVAIIANEIVAIMIVIVSNVFDAIWYILLAFRLFNLVAILFWLVFIPPAKEKREKEENDQGKCQF